MTNSILGKCEDLTGRVFGRLTVVRFSHKKKTMVWLCRCACGNERLVCTGNLQHGNSRSCGCLRSETTTKRNWRHGQSYTLLHGVWHSMLGRCRNPNDKNYACYGGRGISVCDRWLAFENFAEDMGPRPSSSHEIDRYPDKNGNYEPGNVRWATRKQQVRNTRRNLLVEYRGEARPLIDWCDELGLDYDRTYSRVRILGWSPERAFTEPVSERKDKS